MRKVSVICQSVFLFATFLGINAYAEGEVCKNLFDSKQSVLQLRDSSAYQNKTIYNAEVAMEMLKQSALTEIRTSNPSTTHLEFFSAQIPLIQKKLLIVKSEAISRLTILDKAPVSRMREGELAAIKVKKILVDNLEKSYDLLVLEGAQKFLAEEVTYEWYMNHALKTLIFLDVTSRVLDADSKQTFEVLNRKLDTLLGKTKSLYSDNISETLVYSTLSKEFSILTRNKYFTRSIPENPLVPVLFLPRNVDVIEAESLGLHFVSLVSSRRDTVEGKKFPLELAGLQLGQYSKQVDGFRSYPNSKSKWLKYHSKISSYVRGDAALESLYAYILRDAALQMELNSRLETGFRVAGIAVNSHEASQYLKNYFSINKNEVSQIASQRTVEAFLKIIAQIEKEGLASHYRN